MRFLQPTEFFLLKLVQTYEMMTMYHGFVLIGDSFGGKSSILKVNTVTFILKSQESGMLNTLAHDSTRPP